MVERSPAGYRRCPSCGGQSPADLRTCIHCKGLMGAPENPSQSDFDLAAFRWRVLLILMLLGLFTALSFLAGHPLVGALLVSAMFITVVGAGLIAEHENPDDEKGFFDVLLLLFWGGP